MSDGAKDNKKKEISFDRLWGFDELSLYTGLPISTLKELVAAGQIPSFKAGKRRLFHPKTVDEYFKKLHLAC